jgi:hypothetical protein
MQNTPSFSDRYDRFKRRHVVRALEAVQDLIVISLCIGLFSFMVMQLREMVLAMLPPLDFSAVTADILFLLIPVADYLSPGAAGVDRGGGGGVDRLHPAGNYCPGRVGNACQSSPFRLCVSVHFVGAAGGARLVAAHV